jgi:hypothetical protein
MVGLAFGGGISRREYGSPGAGQASFTAAGIVSYQPLRERTEGVGSVSSFKMSKMASLL